jgi:hypothetical protein
MKANNKKSSFKRIISRTLVLGTVLSILMGPWSALASPQNDKLISCGEFIAMMANHQPENPLFPMSHSQLSKEELYLQTTQNMSGKGFHVLDKKSFHDPLEANEFVQVSYAFADGPLGKNLFEQKLFLKKSGVIDSADVGLTTAYDGKVYQTHFEDNAVKPVRLATPIYMNDRLKTDSSSKATFTFDDKSTLTLSEGSVVKITKHIYDPEKDLRQTIVHLSRGTVRFVVTKGKARGSMFKVITPTATAGVRGTEFVVDVAPDGKTNFLVLEGQIETKAMLPGRQRIKPFLVSAGQSQSVSKKGKATEVEKASPKALRSAKIKTSNPKNTSKRNGLSKKVIRKKIQKLTLVKKDKGIKGKVIKAKVLNKGMKAKVLKIANNRALVDVKALGKRIEKIKVEKSSKLMPNDSAKANGKANAKSNAKANAKANAKGNAKANARAVARQVVLEKTRGKGNGQSKKCVPVAKCP